MRRFGLWLVCFTALLVVPVAKSESGDLAKVDRSIGKQPAYKSKPSYCLLVFGPDAAKKVWLVASGDELYADRTGSGDLTEAGNHIAPQADDGDHQRTFKIEVAGASKDAKPAQITVRKFGDYIYVTAEIGSRKWTAANDQNGQLAFADASEKAPIIHFDGPLVVQPTEDIAMRSGERTLFVMVGTRGVGPGTFAALRYDSLPPNISPVAEIDIPQKDKAQSVHQKVVLEQRC